MEAVAPEIRPAAVPKDDWWRQRLEAGLLPPLPKVVLVHASHRDAAHGALGAVGRVSAACCVSTCARASFTTSAGDPRSTPTFGPWKVK
jgi:hypothetical protein